ncbi:hypothetical protein P167DRAFT_608976 [Morchella conica CCBAS932]|uniref:Uncharacterized protein n=1 Tax=Morchella conica CCBAS932 TaxID=1392247 RepID=A0A3N4KFA8_9PEZI|nr:hypothetical protein P167DRAFT_608976 [Morchella conica CCBAS932]
MSKIVHRKTPGQCFESHETPERASKAIPEPTIDNAESFITVATRGTPEGSIVIHERFLKSTREGPTGISCVLATPPEYQLLQHVQHKRAPYDMWVEDVPLKNQRIIRCLIVPDSDCTVIPMSLGEKRDRNYARHGYFLQPTNGGVRMVPGHRKDVKFDLIFWDFERNDKNAGLHGAGARRFPIDTAVLLDPGPPYQSCASGNPVCLIGMDFLRKYPYLMFVPSVDYRGEVDFTLSGNPMFYRSYTTFTELSKTLIVHICAKYDEGTGNIGCGVFFKSGSIFNIFSGVSRYDNNGRENKEHLWERGLLIGIIKALHVVASFPVGHGFTDLVIRTGSPPMNQLLNQKNNHGNDGYKFQRIGDKRESTLHTSIYPDLVQYIRTNFLGKESSVKARFEDFSTNEHYDAIEAAGILASGGAKMEEFYLEKSAQKYNRDYMKSKRISPLGQDPNILKELFTSFGIDGYFKIPSKDALGIMKAADQESYLSLSREDAVFRLGYPAWEGEVAAEPSGFLDEKNYEFYKFSPVSDLKTLKGILGEDSLKKMMICIKNPGWTTGEIMDIISGSTRKLKVHEYLAMQTKEYRDQYLKELESKGLEKGWHFCKDKSWNGYMRKNAKGRTLEECLGVLSREEKVIPNKISESSQFRTQKYSQVPELGDTGPGDTSYHSNYTSESEDISSTGEFSETKRSIKSIGLKANNEWLPLMKLGAVTRMEPPTSESDLTYKYESSNDDQSHSSEMWEDSGTCTNPIELIESDLNDQYPTTATTPKIAGEDEHLKGKQKTSYQYSAKFHQEPEIFHQTWETYLSGSKNKLERSPEEAPPSFRKRKQPIDTAKGSSSTSTSWIPDSKTNTTLYRAKVKSKSYHFTLGDSTDSFESEEGLDLKNRAAEPKWPPFEWALENGFQGTTS